MNLRQAADTLQIYVKTRQQPGQSYYQTWLTLQQKDKYFQGMLEGYMNIRDRADNAQKEGKNEG